MYSERGNEVQKEAWACEILLWHKQPEELEEVEVSRCVWSVECWMVW